MSAEAPARAPVVRLLARVAAQARVGEGLFELWLDAPALAHAEPGQFVHVRCGDGYLRRPFSVYRATAGGVSLLYHVRGRGTRWLTGLAQGDAVDVLGPLGTPFTPPRPGDRLLLVGGGVGVAPLARFAERWGDNVPLAAITGFRSRPLVAGLAPFEALKWPLEVRTDDGTAGRAGRVTDGLAERLAAEDFTRVLTCGPDAMMRAVAEIAAAHGVPCELSVERPMGCGVGVCLGCVVPVACEDGEVRYDRACVEGPVFDARRLTWG